MAGIISSRKRYEVYYILYFYVSYRDIYTYIKFV